MIAASDSLSRMTQAVPLPVEEIKIQPSLERLNANDSPDFEIEDTSSSSETRLFNFLSPEKEISAFAAPINPEAKITIEATTLALITRDILRCSWITENWIVVNDFKWSVRAGDPRQCPDLMVGAPLPRRTTVRQHRRHHQIRTLPNPPRA